MKQRASRSISKNPGQRLGWGTALGFILAVTGITLLLMVLMVATLGSSWLPVYGAEAAVPPTLISRLAPALAPVPTSAGLAAGFTAGLLTEGRILPTPFPDEFFPGASESLQSGFGPVALLPESPGGTGSSVENQSAAAEPVANFSTYLEIPAIGVNAPIQSVGLIELEEDGQHYQQWQVPNAYAVGRHATSAGFGAAGNTVLNGHNNVYGSVFRDLVDLELGDEIIAYEDGRAYHYQVAYREVVEEKDQPLDVRLNNAKWMFPTADERLTLISCWPDIGATHRVIVVAKPVNNG
jgi:LPXTG-site transpeptidase (sortase) family protein